MAYRRDSDLEFLGQMDSSDLDDLVYCLLYDKDGDPRLTEELSQNSEYKRYSPDHSQYWREIAAEVQCFGANSFATIFRGGEGVPYREVLTDVCDHLKVNYNSNSNIEKIENNLLMSILERALEEMSQSEIRDLANELGIKNMSNLNAQMMTGIFQKVFTMGGFKSYQLTVIIVNAIMKALIGRGLSFGGNILLTRTVGILTGPIGWAITAVWTLVDIAGAAYRVTVPSVILIAAMRQKHLYADAAESISF